MKLSHISIQNVAGVSSAQLATQSPIAIVAGRNGHGKSSFAQAVRMALTGDTTARGITLKKELGGLVHDGAKAGEVRLTRTVGMPEMFALVPSGRTTPPADYVPHAAMPFVTSPELFAQLAPNERRAFLFSLMGLSASGPAVVERLLAKGCDRAKIDRVLPMLRSGFEAASKEAKNLATQAKGAWRAVTGETYGAVKAGEWKATLPSAAVAEGEPTDAAKLKACDAALESWQQQVGKLQAEQQRRAELSSRLVSLDEQAAKIGRIEKKLATDEAKHADLAAKAEQLGQRAGTGKRVGLVHDLAAAVAYLLPLGQTPMDQEPTREECDAEAALVAYEREHGPIGSTTGDPEAAAALPAARQARDLMARAIANDKRDLEAARRAGADAEAIRAELAQPAGTGLAEARTQVEALKAERAAIQKAIDAAAAVKRAAAEAKEKTAKAAQHHADVIAWDAIGDALAPDGIPGEMLSEALGPINERLARSALDAEWPRVGIESDMSISVGDGARPYALCSESEKWRADAMLAEAISHLSGLRLLVLDRFDVLDLPGRGDLIAWLDILAQDGELDTAILCGTLKALPTGLPDTVAAHWIENGRLNGSASRELVAAPAAPAAPAVCDPVQVEASSKSADHVEDVLEMVPEVAAEQSGEPAGCPSAAPTAFESDGASSAVDDDGGWELTAAEQAAHEAQGAARFERHHGGELKRQAEAAAARAGGKIVAKYRDPATGQTWSGRGL